MKITTCKFYITLAFIWCFVASYIYTHIELGWASFPTFMSFSAIGVWLLWKAIDEAVILRKILGK